MTRSVIGSFLILAVAGAEVAASGWTRETVVRELRSSREAHRAGPRDILIRATDFSVESRTASQIEAFLSSEGSVYCRRFADASSEVVSDSETIAISRPEAAVVLRRSGPDDSFSTLRIRPDGTGTYADFRANLRSELTDRLEACRLVAGMDVAEFLADSSLSVTGIESTSDADGPLVRLVFETARHSFGFRSGELHFRPDAKWALSHVELKYPSRKWRSRSEIRSITPRVRADGSVMPVSVVTSSRTGYDEPREISRMVVHQIESVSNADALFEPSRHRRIQPAAQPRIDPSVVPVSFPGPQMQARAADASNAADRTSPRPVSESAARIMKVASPASGIAATVFFVSFIDRRRRRSQESAPKPSSPRRS